MKRLFGTSAAVVVLFAFWVPPLAAGASKVPPLAWSPTTASGTYNFGTLDAGAGATKNVTFRLTASFDSGSGDIKTVTLSRSPAFTLTANTCLGISLGPGKSCTATLKYAPKAAGENDAATLTATATQATASLSVLGMAGSPNLAWSPSPYDFGTVTAGQTPTQTFTLANSGTGTSVTLSALLTGSNAFSVPSGDDTCSGTRLGPDQSCEVTVQFAPTTTETDDATLTAGGAGDDISGMGQPAGPLEITGINAGDTALNLDGITPIVLSGSNDNTLVAEVANIPPGGVSYLWRVTTPNTPNYLVDPTQTDSSLFVRADSIPNFFPQLITFELTVTPNGGGSPVSVSGKVSYRNSALTIGMSTTCIAGGPDISPQPSAPTIPSNGSLTITQLFQNHIGPGCNIGIGLSGTITYSEGAQVLATVNGPGTGSPAINPTLLAPVTIPASQLGVGNDTVTVTYVIYNAAPYAPFSVNVPVTVLP